MQSKSNCRLSRIAPSGASEVLCTRALCVVQSGENVFAGQAEMVLGSFDGTPTPDPTAGSNLLTEISNFAAPV